MKDRSCEDHRRRGDGSSLRWGAARTVRTSQLGERTNQSETDKKIIRQKEENHSKTEQSLNLYILSFDLRVPNLERTRPHEAWVEWPRRQPVLKSSVSVG